MLTLRQTGTLRQNTRIALNQQTDQLYEPLREALRKSTITKTFLSHDPRATFHRTSASNRKMRLLSPTEAENIKNAIFIPVNKELVPTRNIQRVLGKQFTPVDVSQKVGEPLTPEQFNLKKQGGVSEIVYEIREEDNPYQLYASNNYPSPRVSKQLAASVAAEPRLQATPAEAPLPRPLFVSHSSRDLVGKQMSISLANSGNSGSDTATLVSGAFSPKKYQFKQNLRGGKPGQEEYKYNLFSVADGRCDLSCHGGCCADSEVVAGRVGPRGWS